MFCSVDIQYYLLLKVTIIKMCPVISNFLHLEGSWQYCRPSGMFFHGYSGQLVARSTSLMFVVSLATFNFKVIPTVYFFYLSYLIGAAQVIFSLMTLAGK
jgi:hypothetical protein